MAGFGMAMEGLKFNELKESDLLTIEVDHMMNMNELIHTVNSVVLNTCVKKFKYNDVVLDILLNEGSEYINYLLKEGKIGMNKRALKDFSKVFTLACGYYKKHFDNISKDLFNNVTNGHKLFIDEIEL